jgi:hypothetical protein
MKSATIALVGAAVCLSACFASGDPSIRTDKAGNTIFRANRINRFYVLGSIDDDIALERAGKPLPRAFKDTSWEAHWLRRLKIFEQQSGDGAWLNDDRQVYVDYVVRGRHAAGLPDLPGYPSSVVHQAKP